MRVDGKTFGILGPLAERAPPPPPPPPPPTGPCTPGVNFGGGDFAAFCPAPAARAARTAAACRALCASVPGCAAFVLDTCAGSAPGCDKAPAPTPRCWLKRRVLGRGTASACSCTGFMNGTNPSPQPPRPAPTSRRGGQCPPGHGIPPMQQLGAPLILPTRTIYSFAAAGVAVSLTFASPKFMEDMDSFLPVALAQVRAQNRTSFVSGS